MEKAKISPYQLFVLILLFQLGSALLLPLGIDAKQNAWISILMAMIGGFFLFLIYHRIYLYYPDSLPTTYVQKIFGKKRRDWGEAVKTLKNAPMTKKFANRKWTRHQTDPDTLSL